VVSWKAPIFLEQILKAMLSIMNSW
jgi:hypothetical protein